jgi:hypothetical protein
VLLLLGAVAVIIVWVATGLSVFLGTATLFSVEGTVLWASSFTPKGLMPPPKGFRPRLSWFFNQQGGVTFAINQPMFYAGILLAIAGTTIGFGAGYVTQSRQGLSQLTIDDTWLFNGSIPVDGAIGYNSDALLEADILLPKIEAIDIKIKFLAHPDGESHRTRVVAYMAQVRIASLEKKNIPSKYLEKRVVQSKAGGITTGPLEQVTYVAQFSFDLLDKDGFKLGEVTGPDQWLSSGRSNTFQEVTTKPFDLDFVGRITAVRTHLSVLRCESCR